MKKIVVITPYFDPENFPINNFVYGIKDKGLRVEVLTVLPNYRKKGFYKNYSLMGPFKEKINDVTIYRVPIIPRYNDTFLSILFFYLSYFASNSVFIFFYSLFNINKIKHIITFCGSPVYVGFFGSYLGLITRSQTSQWVQDIWPEAIETTKGLKNKFIKNILSSLQNLMWRSSDILFAQSNMLYNYLKDEFHNQKTYTLYNPVRDDFNEDRAELLNHEKKIFSYMGNIGGAQLVNELVEAFVKSSDELSELHICGDGSDLNKLKKNYQSSNIFWHGWLNEKELENIIKITDFFLLNLNNKGRQNFIIPSKIQTYFKNSRPVICLSRGAAGQLIDEINGGLVVRNDTLEDKIRLFNLSKNFKKDELSKMSNNNRKYYEENFKQEVVVEKFLNIINLK